MSIAGEEYEKLLNFSAFINKDYISFMKNVHCWKYWENLKILKF